jgi:hypothetical protein
MATATKLGIWMDHASAHVMEFTTDPIQTKTIELASTVAQKEHGFGQNELMMHHKEQQKQSDYYKKLGEVIVKYKEVVLFGPTDAKVELFNHLKGDLHFSKIKITVKDADKMTENQQHAFVRDFFAKQIIRV